MHIFTVEDLEMYAPFFFRMIETLNSNEGIVKCLHAFVFKLG